METLDNSEECQSDKYKSEDYKKLTQAVRQLLRKGLGPQAADGSHPEHDAYVKLLYEKYTERFINDNNKIWSTGTSFIPLSLGGLLTIKDMSVENTAVIALGSVMLMFFWVLLAENHRAFQNRAQAIVNALEYHINFDLGGSPKLDCHFIASKRTFSVQNIRWWMFAFITVAWTYTVVHKYQETRPNPQQATAQTMTVKFADQTKLRVQLDTVGQQKSPAKK